MQALWRMLLTSELGPLALLVAANPVVYSLQRSAAYFPPDSILYAVMARDFLDGSFLHVAGWGGTGAGVILPPLFPALVAAGSLLSPDRLAVGEYVSTICIVLASVPLYLTARVYAGRAASLAAVATLQWMGFHFLTALQPLTEGLFIFASASALYVLTRLLRKPESMHWALACGLVAALVFFSRQIGLLFLPCAVLLVLLPDRSTAHHTFKRRLLTAGAVLAGFAVLVGPYTAVLYSQTGQLPLTQHFVAEQRPIEATPGDRRAIEAIRRQTDGTYESTYAERRRLRRLNEAGTAMLSSLVVDSTSSRNPLRAFAVRITNPAILSNVAINAKHVVTFAGPVLALLFCVAMLLPLARSADEPNRWVWSTPWAWVVVYLCGLSLVTSKVDRYVMVILPFLFVQAAAFLEMDGRRLPAVASRYGRIPLGVGLLPIAMLVGLLAAPVRFWDAQHYPKSFESELPLGELRGKVQQGDPMFSLFPADAYFLGGSYRVQPDASATDLAEFGRRNGVKWLVVRRSPQIINELKYYSESDWYLDPTLGGDTNLVYAGSSSDDVLRLYRIRDQ